MKPRSLPAARSGLLLSALLASIATALPAAPAADLPELLPRDLEIELALSALPEHVREAAGVWVLERGGYVQARGESNGFNCLVRRSGAVPGSFDRSVLPICYDREGSNTLLPAVLDEVEMLEAGDAPEAVAATIEARWEAGKYSPPGPGVSYMLSPVFCLRGQCGQYVPHTMFYAPYETGETVGANADLFDHVPSIQAPGTPAAMMVIPVDGPGRDAILNEGADLRRRVRDLLGFEESPSAR